MNCLNKCFDEPCMIYDSHYYILLYIYINLHSNQIKFAPSAFIQSKLKVFHLIGIRPTGTIPWNTRTSCEAARYLTTIARASCQSKDNFARIDGLPVGMCMFAGPKPKLCLRYLQCRCTSMQEPYFLLEDFECE